MKANKAPEQYISKSAVIAEIEKLQDSTMDEDGNFYSVEAQAKYDILCVLEEYLDTLKVKEDTISNEPLISSELLTASADYARKQLANPDYPAYNDEYELLCAYEAGANWQKEQMIEKVCEYLQAHIDKDLTIYHEQTWYKRDEFINRLKKAIEQ